VHFGALLHFLKIVLLIWASAGISTALYGLIWTCRKSNEMFREQPSESAAAD